MYVRERKRKGGRIREREREWKRCIIKKMPEEAFDWLPLQDKVKNSSIQVSIFKWKRKKINNLAAHSKREMGPML
jgi:hypothetical protein